MSFRARRSCSVKKKVDENSRGNVPLWLFVSQQWGKEGKNFERSSYGVTHQDCKQLSIEHLDVTQSLDSILTVYPNHCLQGKYLICFSVPL